MSFWKKPRLSNKLTLSGNVWIAADLHLGPDNPDTVQDFLQFLHSAQRQAQVLILGGDIFNAWIGDDQIARPAPWLVQVSDALRAFASNHALYLMRGNRDFLLGQTYARHVHATLLPDQTVLDTSAGLILMSHGDEYCLDDLAYQRFRYWVRKPWLQKLYLACPLSLRQRIADSARAGSQRGKQYKSTDIMDVQPAAIVAACEAHPVLAMVHGHTHRPAVHDIPGFEPVRRWVLPDWDAEPGGIRRGGYISIQGSDLCLHQWGMADQCQTLAAVNA